MNILNMHGSVWINKRTRVSHVNLFSTRGGSWADAIETQVDSIAVKRTCLFIFEQLRGNVGRATRKRGDENVNRNWLSLNHIYTPGHQRYVPSPFKTLPFVGGWRINITISRVLSRTSVRRPACMTCRGYPASWYVTETFVRIAHCLQFLLSSSLESLLICPLRSVRHGQFDSRNRSVRTHRSLVVVGTWETSVKHCHIESLSGLFIRCLFGGYMSSS